MATVLLIATGPAPADTFEPASTVEQTRRQIERIPTEREWWKVTGEDLRWNHLNVAKFLPTVTVYRAGPVSELKSAPNPAIGKFEIEARGHRMPFKEFLDSEHSTTMGVVILHRGRIVFEHYPRQQPYQKPIVWSMAKVIGTTLVWFLEERGLVDTSRPISHYLPELADSSFGPVTVRNLLDMATGLDCGDEYDDPEACYFRFAASIGNQFYDENSPDNPYEYIAGLEVESTVEQGTERSYSGVNSFVLGWLVEKLLGMPYQDAVSKEIWTRIGAEADAAYPAPRFGVPYIHDGLMATLRDLARFGLLFTPRYTVVSDQRLISESYLEFLSEGGRAELLKNEDYDPREHGILHTVNQWTVYDNHNMEAGGWGGQGMLISPDRELVAVWSGFLDDEWQDDNLYPAMRAIFDGVYGEVK